MSGGIYELYRMTLLAHFETQQTDDQSPHEVQIKVVNDKHCMTVETQIRVFPKRPNKSHGPLQYTVSLYHTKSSLMVNGREAHKFTDDHKKAVSSLLMVQNLGSIDEGLRTVILRELDKIQFNPSNDRINQLAAKKQTGVAIDSIAPPVSTIDQQCPKRPSINTNETISPDTQNSTEICLHCDKPSENDVIECSVCMNWVHFMCEGISKAEFQKYCVDEDITYTCTSCAVDIANEAEAKPHKVTPEQDPSPTTPGLTPNYYSAMKDTQLTLSQSTVVPFCSSILTNTQSIQPNSNMAPCHSNIGIQLTQSKSCMDPNTLTNTQLIQAKSGMAYSHSTIPADTELTQLKSSGVPFHSNTLTDTQLTQPMKSVAPCGAALTSSVVTLQSYTQSNTQITRATQLKCSVVPGSNAKETANTSSSCVKTYILTMENKLKELQNTNRHLKMKMIQQEEDIAMGTTSTEASPDRPQAVHGQTRVSQGVPALHARITHLETTLMEHRVAALEHRIWSSQNLNYNASVNCMNHNPGPYYGY